MSNSEESFKESSVRNSVRNFNLYKLKELSPNDSKAYIIEYFVPLSNGTHAMLNNGMYIIKEEQEIKRTYFNRMSKELQNYYFKEYCEVKSICYNPHREVFFEDYINLCPQMKYKFDEFYLPTEKTEVKLNYILKFLKEILCSDKNDSYEFLLKWISNLIKGNKNNSCLYLKGVQGVGKSSLYYFLSKYVLGNNLCLETGSDPIRTKFNQILGGKLLVNIEELENFSRNEWESISSTLKRMITSSNITLQDKCTKAYESTNINNYILCSNNDAIKDDDGRRYFILDISTKKLGNRDYYDSLYKCFNDEVGEAFFHYIYKINTDNFNPQSFPLTDNKLDSLSKRLDNVYKFLKEEYILSYLKVESSISDLYAEYKAYCSRINIKGSSKEDFHKKLTEIGIKRIKKNNKLHYDIPLKDLVELAKNKNWLHELDEFDEKKNERTNYNKNFDSDSDGDTDNYNSVFSDSSTTLNFDD
jgi:hypothetical protein